MPRAGYRSRLTPEEALRQVEQRVRAAELQTDIREAEVSLKFFLKLAWPTIYPGRPFQDNWHLDCLCEHLEALLKRQIKRLIINIMPRSLKSGLIAVALPAWWWITHPEERFLVASFGRQLALRDSRYCRNLIVSQWYQARWAGKFSLALDQNEKGRFDNDRGGTRLIASVEGGILGEGGSCTIYDDPNDLDRMIKEPESYPQSVREWYSGTASSRHIDPKTDVRVCVQQRSSYGGDLTEYLLELGGWEHLVIPNEWEGARTLGPLAFPDPRVRLGELMFPSRFGPEETVIEKREKKSHYAGQYQQRPSQTGKSGLKREWFQFWSPRGTVLVDESGKAKPIRISLPDGTFVERVPVELPEAFEQVVTSLDCAFKGTDENDFVSNQAWGRVAANTFLIGREYGHLNFPETLSMVRRFSERFSTPEKLVEAKANGPAVIDTLANEIPGLIPVEPQGGKWSRVAAISGYVEAGNVFLPNPDLFPWVWDLLSELAAGQAAKHDDDTDAMTQALIRLYGASARSAAPEFRVAPRVGEPASACHIVREKIPDNARRIVVVVPARAALWIVELPTGGLRVTAELGLEKLDAVETGKAIGRAALPDIARWDVLREIGKERKGPALEIFLPKVAFAEIEPVGSWAEMLEDGMRERGPEDSLADVRTRWAGVRTDMVELEDGATDRLRSLLAWAPEDFRTETYDRARALALAQEDLQEYQRYMGRVDGRVIGDFPKLKISPDCPMLIAELGGFRKDSDPAPFVEALLLGVCAPRTFVRTGQVREISWPPPSREASRGQGLMKRKFSMGKGR